MTAAGWPHPPTDRSNQNWCAIWYNLYWRLVPSPNKPVNSRHINTCLLPKASSDDPEDWWCDECLPVYFVSLQLTAPGSSRMQLKQITAVKLEQALWCGKVLLVPENFYFSAAESSIEQSSFSKTNSPDETTLVTRSNTSPDCGESFSPSRENNKRVSGGPFSSEAGIHRGPGRHVYPVCCIQKYMQKRKFLVFTAPCW